MQNEKTIQRKLSVAVIPYKTYFEVARAYLIILIVDYFTNSFTV